MKLDVIVGYREYLEPTPVTRDELQRFLTASDPNLELPEIGWSPHLERTCYASFITEPCDDPPGRFDLLLEYLGDSFGQGVRVAIVVPFESLLEHGPRTIGARRVRAFLERALERLGPRAVRARTLALSENSQNVLQTLGQRAQGRPLGSGVTPFEIDLVESLAPRIDNGFGSFDGLRHNYTHAVLSLCEQIAADRLLFTGAERVKFLADHMARNHLHIRPDLSPEAILEQLEPDGEIYRLLSSPVAGQAESTGLSER